MSPDGNASQKPRRGVLAARQRGFLERLLPWRTRLRLGSFLHYNLWFVPLGCTSLGIAAGLLIPEIDQSGGIDLGLGIEASEAQGLLGGLAGATLTLIGFLLTIITLVLSIIYGLSPRLMRVLIRSPANKLAIGVFTGTLVYVVLVIRAINQDFVPELAMLVALALALTSLVLFLMVVGLLVRSVRTSAVCERIGSLTRPVIRQIYPVRGSDADPGETPSAPHMEARSIRHSGRQGVLVAVDVVGALELAAKADAVLLLEPGIGDFLYGGSTLFRVHEPGVPIDDRRLQGLVLVDKERTFEQDPAFGFRVLVDVATRALSPATNDPTTAVQALDQIEDLLRMLSDRRLHGAVGDGEGTPRLYYLAPTWADYVALACQEIRYYGADQPQVARRMRAMLERLLGVTPEDRREPLERELAMLDSGVARAFADPAERGEAMVPDPQGIGASRVG